jgi:valyl-tRNA synthetase
MPYFPSRFDYQALEPIMYQKWLESGGFSPDSQSDADPRSILMPPPNANGSLHIGHAYEVAIQDTLIRYWRMKGYKTLWQPGVDHAGFETQVVFEKKLEKEGRTRFGMDRQDLYKEIYEFSVANQQNIRQQLERLGASCDWTRFHFMLEPDLVKTVYATFKQLYDDGLIYRAKRPVHWCTKHQITLSDLETSEREQIDPLYYIKYGPLTLATVRPETKFGDTAVAVNPHDERYQQYIGQKIEIETVLGPATIKVIADDYVNREFGTGVVKITPAHDPNDFEVSQRHNLPIKEVIDKYGKLNEHAGPFAGLKVNEARQKVVAAMQSKGLIEKIDENYTHSVKVCYKCGTIIEPRILDQWWLALTKPGKESGKVLRDLASDAVNKGETKFVTERFTNQFYRWMENLRDWPLSRQIVWGIQLPVWYGKDGQVVVTAGEEPANAHELTRDTDVFDTWFSSCQWPFTTLTANNENDLQTFYPSTVMAPGYDIIFFWVARMMMLSLYTQGQTPYKVIYLHGLIRDKDRQKMSKSKGNVIDPLGVAEEFGADAIRLALLYGNAPGTDPIISIDKIRGMRNFVTKLWNIARYITLNSTPETKAELIAVTDADSLLHHRLTATVHQVTQALESYNLHIAAEALYQFVWHDFADVYIEAAKLQLQDEAKKSTTQGNLMHVLLTVLRLAHPFVPFVSEAIWQETGNEDNLLMNSSWPEL